MAYFFCVVFGVPPDGISLLVLGLTIWIIYTVDHLLDAKRIIGSATSFRHRFHQQNFGTILLLSVGVGSITFVLSLAYLNPDMIFSGLALGFFALVYLLGHRFLYHFKETAGAMLYTAGILIPTVCQPEFTLSDAKLLLVFQFFLVVLMNLILFSNFDRKNDEQNQQTSIATRMGEITSNRLVWIIFFIEMIVFLINAFHDVEFLMPSMTILAMALALATIKSIPVYFSQHDRFRYFGDAIFFLPLLYILLR